MTPETLEKILGTGFLHEGKFGDVIRKHFPDATEVDMYGAGVMFSADTGEVVAISCKGRTVRLDSSGQPQPEGGTK